MCGFRKVVLFCESLDDRFWTGSDFLGGVGPGSVAVDSSGTVYAFNTMIVSLSVSVSGALLLNGTRTSALNIFDSTLTFLGSTSVCLNAAVFLSNSSVVVKVHSLI